MSSSCSSFSSRPARAGLFLGLVLAAAPVGRAFLVIDPAGVREPVSDLEIDPEVSSGGNTFTTRHVGLATKEKRLSAFWLRHEVGGETDARARTRTWGLSLKLTEPDGLEQFIKFDRLPQIEAGLLWNHTTYASRLGPDPAQDDDRPAWSVTVQAGYQRQEIEYLPDTGNPAFALKRADDEGLWGSVAWGAYWRNVPGLRQIALLAAAEARRATNYADLPKVTVSSFATVVPAGTDGISRVLTTKAKTVRRGDLASSTIYPLTVAIVVPVEMKWPLHLLGKVGEKDEGLLYLAPYYRVTPAAEAGTARAHGVRLTFRSKAYSDKAPRGKISYPLSVFVERGTDFGGGPWSTSTGVATVFSWGD